VAGRQCLAVFSGWDGKAGGLDSIDGKSPEQDNPSTVRPSTLVNNRRHKALIQVRCKGGDVDIKVLLDGKPFTSWKGKVSSLGLSKGWRLPKKDCFGVGVFENKTTFHSFRIREVAE
jgi:hypothetical protein